MLAIGAVEVLSLAVSDGKPPGDLGFDPLNLKSTLKLEGDKLTEMQVWEIKLIRLGWAHSLGFQSRDDKLFWRETRFSSSSAHMIGS